MVGPPLTFSLLPSSFSGRRPFDTTHPLTLFVLSLPPSFHLPRTLRHGSESFCSSSRAEEPIHDDIDHCSFLLVPNNVVPNNGARMESDGPSLSIDSLLSSIRQRETLSPLQLAFHCASFLTDLVHSLLCHLGKLRNNYHPKLAILASQLAYMGLASSLTISSPASASTVSIREGISHQVVPSSRSN